MGEKRTFIKASIKDVARLAEVSVTTVSHVVSRTPGYSAETIKKVKDAIEELNYVPSYVARGLRQKSTHTIGVCTTDPFETGGRVDGSFADRLWSGILAEADDHRFKVMYFPRSIRESEDPAEFINGQIDGLIICANRYDRRPAAAARAGLPVVMVARTFDIPDGVESVAADEKENIGAALEHLHQLGHRKIAYVAGPAFEVQPSDAEALSYDDVARARLEAYQEWMTRRSPGVAPRWQLTPGWDPVDLSDTLRGWMDSDPPTAIAACSDAMGRAMLKAAQELGIDVPGQLSVVGIDNEEGSLYSQPPLTTVEVPIHHVGRLAVQRLLSRLHKGASAPTLVLPAPQIHERASTGPCPSSEINPN